MVEVGDDFGLPAVPHVRAHGPQVGRSEHKQHLQHLGRADLDGELHDHVLVAGVAAEGEMVHAEVLVDEELQALGLVGRQAQPLGRTLGNLSPNVAVIFQKTLSQVVNQ